MDKPTNPSSFFSWLELWFLRRFLRKHISQSRDHDQRIQAIYFLVRERAEEAFPEDNAPTLDEFLCEQFEKTQKSLALRRAHDAALQALGLVSLLRPGPEDATEEEDPCQANP